MGLDNMIRRVKLEQCANDLIQFKRDYLEPLYSHGPLGATIVENEDGCATNKCMMSFRLCENPWNVEKNVERIEILLEAVNDEEEYEIINNLYNLYTRFIRIKESKETRLDDKLCNINKIVYELRRYNTFKNNQNVFDNYISLLKINERLNHNGIKINFKPEFKVNETTSKDLEIEFRKYLEMDFKSIIWKVNLNNELNYFMNENQGIYALFEE